MHFLACSPVLHWFTDSLAEQRTASVFCTERWKLWKRKILALEIACYNKPTTDSVCLALVVLCEVPFPLPAPLSAFEKSLRGLNSWHCDELHLRLARLCKQKWLLHHSYSLFFLRTSPQGLFGSRSGRWWLCETSVTAPCCVIKIKSQRGQQNTRGC